MKKFSEGLDLRFTIQTSGGRSGSRANSRPWHVSHALRHFRRVPTRLLSRMRAGCVSRDAFLCPSMDAILWWRVGYWRSSKILLLWYWNFFLNSREETLNFAHRGISMRGIYRSAVWQKFSRVKENYIYFWILILL